MNRGKQRRTGRFLVSVNIYTMSAKKSISFTISSHKDDQCSQFTQKPRASCVQLDMRAHIWVGALTARGVKFAPGKQIITAIG